MREFALLDVADVAFSHRMKVVLEIMFEFMISGDVVLALFDFFHHDSVGFGVQDSNQFSIEVKWRFLSVTFELF